MLLEFLQFVSIANIGKDRGPKLTHDEAASFEKTITLLSREGNADLLWHVIYAHQLTQERREIDALQAEVVLAFGYAAASILCIPVTLTLKGGMSPLAKWMLIAASLLILLAAFRYAILARRKQISYMISLCIQLFAWGEQSETADRDAL